MWEGCGMCVESWKPSEPGGEDLFIYLFVLYILRGAEKMVGKREAGENPGILK